MNVLSIPAEAGWFGAELTTPADAPGGIAVTIALGVMSLFSAVGVLGYAHARPMLRARLWRAWAVLQPLVDVAATSRELLPETDVGERTTLVAALVVVAPLVIASWVALFRYAYRSPQLWDRRRA